MTKSKERQNFEKRLAESWERERKISDELESTYAHIRALVGQAFDLDAKGMRHALVGLLPEVRFEPEVKARMQEKGMGHLIERREAMVDENWRELMGGDDR